MTANLKDFYSQLINLFRLASAFDVILSFPAQGCDTLLFYFFYVFGFYI